MLEGSARCGASFVSRVHFCWPSTSFVALVGVDIPTPESWHSERDLEISYLDDDMMIARTAGGEPHLMLRHSTCSTDDPYCNIETELTMYFMEARAKYGEGSSRCLVDRAYGEECEESAETPDSLQPILNALNFRPFEGK